MALPRSTPCSWRPFVLPCPLLTSSCLCPSLMAETESGDKSMEWGHPAHWHCLAMDDNGNEGPGPSVLLSLQHILILTFNLLNSISPSLLVSRLSRSWSPEETPSFRFTRVRAWAKERENTKVTFKLPESLQNGVRRQFGC